MSAKLYKNTKIQQDSIETMDQSLTLKQKLKIYKIKVCDLRENEKMKETERAIYLSLTFNNNKREVFQTNCIDIVKENAHFQVKTLCEIERIEVIDYDSMKRLCKFSLKGLNKEFTYKHTEPKHNFSVLIQRSDVKIVEHPMSPKLYIAKDMHENVEKNKDSVITNSTEASVF